MERTAVIVVLLLAAGATTVGCAQCQQTSDSFASTALDGRVITRIASVLGENPPGAAPEDRRPPTPQVLAVAETSLPARRRTTPAKASIQQVAANEPLEAAAPMPDAEPIETVPLPEPSLRTSHDSLAAVKRSSADSRVENCDDTCCEPGVACPLDRPCPILGACRECPACLAGRRCGKLFTRPEPGPPPVRYRPAMPPKFLPVPTQPVLSPARPEAPDPWHGDIEFGWGPEITFPGRD